MSELIRVCDLETTGLDPRVDRVTEVGAVDLIVNDDGTVSRGPMWSELCNPGMPIPIGASAVNDITDEMVAGKPTFGAEHVSRLTAGPPVALCAHYAKFDRGFFDPAGYKWICTYKVAIWLWPDCPIHKNNALRYWLKLKLAMEEMGQLHRALRDAYITAAILRRAILSGATIDEMIQVSAAPAILPRLVFGKHAMKPIADVPADYLSWVLKQGGGGEGFDEDVLATAMHELQRRRDAR